MSEQDNIQKDSYDITFENKLKLLKECQNSKNIDSCMKCDKIFECQTRKDYVDATYQSMIKGQSGGFDF
ncbi:MAG: hypothetical protein SPI03_04635 [Campylobacter sputorum]|uniref:hypothetical protein n=1 Tax=Campylobacter sputorum TaxID=206 RepID=UPI000B772328|nr:hypothetical protein [Campylobacter sputorum]ASM38746.1 hypothetical protein CSPARA_1190 [Campylobacter sputorum bv. paraureolyticus LMG 11764]MDY6120601.1 hypothetical protein [Campylobacter sputorum]